ncbi:O-methyltransferase family 2 protein [Heterostelium album PN500]|uniref:O-methyltransferase family 2 protein n=1 Tax=Heterostelium pallidum (strain ATCC 26659 / Pp 5 / PN500) TaxID=670386 RepID=D3B9H3_HETP5|nr:O-methyltransferase family 2 protein [Heterostelium album PN500]EFA81885.1 O-methyltransferase family 2 protein [Heterostelium album PN500]|eukprot:XP_020434002.1 O-methyltransferase family 2 protein [Heterostelium album PN500]
MESIFSSLLASSLLVGLPSIIILSLIEALKVGPKTLEELANVTKTNQRHLNSLLNKLSNDGYFFYNEEDQKYEINANLPNIQDSIFYNENKDCIYGLFQHPSLSKAWGSTQDFLDTRHPSLNQSNFINFIDEKDSFLKKIFDSAMTQKSELLKVHSKITGCFNFSKFKQIVELNGGFGYLGFQILKDHPNTSVVILEMEETIKHGLEIATNDPQKKELIDCNQIVFKLGDMFQPRTIPEADAYLLTEVLSVWSRHDCMKILQSISNVMRKEKTLTGKSPSLIVIESILDDQISKNRNDESLDQLQEEESTSHSIPKMVMGSIISVEKRSRLEWDFLFRDSGLYVNNIKKMNQTPFLTLIELTVVNK